MMPWTSLNFPNANSPMMEQMIFFHDHSMIILTMIIFSITYMMLNILWNNKTNRYLLEGQSIETIWTLFPILMLSFIALPSLRLLYLMEESFNPSMIIKVTGRQWYWSYEYSDFNISFDAFMMPLSELKTNMFRLMDTDNRMALPFNVHTQLLISSSDVIHSWSMPALGLKVDAVPGRLNMLTTYASRPGLYFGQCSEICGANHSFMPISLEVFSLNMFALWIKKMS